MFCRNARLLLLRAAATTVVLVLPTLAVAQAGPVATLSVATQVFDTAPAPLSSALQMAALRLVPSQLSRDCSVRSPAFTGQSPLRSMRRALRESRPIKVLAIGSSSIVGVGASSPVAGYTVRLEHDLEGFLKGFDIDLIPRGMSGEVAEGTASRLKTEVAANRPDLVVWQVGTNDAMAHVGEERFTNCLRTTLQWLAQQGIDVVLINPQYVERLASDDYYRKIVEIIADIGREERVLVVDRYQAMADLAYQNGNNTYLAADRFHLNDLGYRCMAEYSARAIVGGILHADAELATGTSQTPIPATAFDKN